MDPRPSGSVSIPQPPPRRSASKKSQKKRTFKRKQEPLPDDYKKLKAIPKEDKDKHTKRWLRAQEMRRGIVRPQRRTHAAQLLKYTSHSYYNNLWAEAQFDLRDILKEEKKRGTVSTADRKEMFAILTTVYLKYLNLMKKLDTTYDQMVHPQKRILVRKLLDLVIGRLLDIRGAMVKCEKSEYFYFGEYCFRNKMLPDEFDIPIPKYYFHDPSQKMQERDRMYNEIQEEKERKAQAELDRLEEEKKAKAKALAEEAAAFAMDDEGGGGDKEQKVDTAAVLMVQRMERARQARMRFRAAKYMAEEEVRALAKKKRDKKRKQVDPAKAVIIIQKVARGFIARAKVKRMREQELELLGLKPPKPGVEDSAANIAGKLCSSNEKEVEKAKERRRQARRRNQKVYEQAQEAIEQRLELLEAPEMEERFKFQIRTWMLDVKERTGKLPALIPKPEAGGTRYFICPNQLSPEMLEAGKMATDKEYAKKRKKELKKEKKKEKKEKKEKKKKFLKGIIDNPKLEPPSQLEDMVSSNVEYNKIWRGRDEEGNPEQKHEEQFIIHEKRQQVGQEVRDKVDAAMVEELKFLKELLEGKKKKRGGKKSIRGSQLSDTGPEAPKVKKSRPKQIKVRMKLKKKDEEKKKHKFKDMTKDIKAEVLFEELVQKGIIRKFPAVRLDSLVGSRSLVNEDLRTYYTENPFPSKEYNEEKPFPQGDANPLPAFGDVVRAVTDICILPMGSEEVHKLAPHVRSVLICGPEGSGKRSLVNAICTELNATLIDLTCTNIAKKYPKKKGLKMLMHLVEKVGKMVPPCVIKIDDVEKTYMKKVPKPERKFEPKRLKKSINKLLDQFNPGDQMLLIGTSSEPWRGSPKLLKKDFEKYIYIPRPDYGTRFEVWRNLLIPNAEHLAKDVNFSLLAKLSDGWTAGPIKKAADKVINAFKEQMEKEAKDRQLLADEPWMLMQSGGKKVSTLGKKYIKVEQFLDELSKYDPVFLQQDKAWTKFYNATPLMKARLGVQAAAKEGKDKKKK